MRTVYELGQRQSESAADCSHAPLNFKQLGVFTGERLENLRSVD